MFLSVGIGCLSVIVFCISLVMAAIGVLMDFDYDYCERKYYGNFYFRAVTFVVMHVIPGILTISGFMSASVNVNKARIQKQSKRGHHFDRDYSANGLNLVAYLLYAFAWVPYLVVVFEFPGTTDKKLYTCAWIGISRSAITSFMYSAANRDFRHAFAHLFNYCCCKSTLSSSLASRHRGDVYRPSCDVKVHIMHNIVHTQSPKRNRGASTSRETQEL